jgi:hypothetical protein
MRARAAYISSLGTTAILVVAALLMLTLVSALVAFHGWPGTAAGSGVQSVPLAPEGATTVKVERTRVAVGQRRRAARRTQAAASVRRRTTTGLVKHVSAGGGPLLPGLVMVPAPEGPQASPPPGTPTVPPPSTPQGPGEQTPVPTPVQNSLPPLPDLAGELPPPPGAARPGDGGDDLAVMVGALMPPLPGLAARR